MNNTLGPAASPWPVSASARAIPTASCLIIITTCWPAVYSLPGSPFARLLRGPLLGGLSLLRFFLLLRHALGQFLAAGFAVPFLVGLGRDLALHEELGKLASLRFALERHHDPFNASGRLT